MDIRWARRNTNSDTNNSSRIARRQTFLISLWRTSKRFPERRRLKDSFLRLLMVGTNTSESTNARMTNLLARRSPMSPLPLSLEIGNEDLKAQTSDAKREGKGMVRGS